MTNTVEQAIKALEAILNAGRGTSGRLILERDDEKVVLSALAALREAAPAPAGMTDLPPLPDAWGVMYSKSSLNHELDRDGYTADQMRGYVIDDRLSRSNAPQPEAANAGGQVVRAAVKELLVDDIDFCAFENAMRNLEWIGKGIYPSKDYDLDGGFVSANIKHAKILSDAVLPRLREAYGALIAAVRDGRRDARHSSAAAVDQEAAQPAQMPVAISRDEFHDKAWALYHAKTFDDTQLAKVNIHTIRAVFNAVFDAALPLPSQPAQPTFDLMPVIQWLEGGCDPKWAAKELRIYQNRIDAAPCSADAKDAEMLDWIASQECQIEILDLPSACDRYRVRWPDLDEAQSNWFDTPRMAIQAAMQPKQRSCDDRSEEEPT